MASTNKTTNYDLSQYVGTDKPTYLGDYNSDMQKIDSAIKDNADDISTLSNSVTEVTNTANTANTNASTALTEAVSAGGTATTALNKANANETAIGQIVESGSNLNGRYIKFSDGTLICTKEVTGSINITTGWGSGYTSGTSDTLNLGDYPYEFVGSLPSVSISLTRGGYNGWLTTLQSPSLTSPGYTGICRFTSQSNFGYTIEVMAIGRWK